MASTAALSVVGRALTGLLAESCPRDQWDGALFELYQAANFRSPMREGVSLYLYRVIPSGVRRNLAPRPGAGGKLNRPRLPVALHYLVTPWARSAERQHELLGWALRTFDDTTTLDATFLNSFATGGQVVFGPDESVTLVLESLSIQDALNVWEVGKPNIQISVSYQVGLVNLDSERGTSLQLPVQTRDLEAGTP
jgi:hypothetical protein